MAIPKFEDFLYPFLVQLKDKDISTKEMKNALVKHFNLTEEDCSLKTKSGSAFQLNDRIGWCRQWLRRALFIEIPQRGIYSITQRGKDYLQSHTDLRQEDLLLYPEYAEYAHMPTASKVISSSEKKDTESVGTDHQDDSDDVFEQVDRCRVGILPVHQTDAVHVCIDDIGHGIHLRVI